MIKYQFKNNQNNKRLIQVIESNLKINFNAAQSMLRKADVKVNNQKVKQNIVLDGGEIITCYLKEYQPEIIYQDRNILIVNKPTKYETISENQEKDLTSILKKQFDFCKPCHRLDTNTSGVNVFALNEHAYAEILEAFRLGKVQKKYLTVVSGNAKIHEILTHYLVKESQNNKVKIYNRYVPNSVAITTEYTIINKINEDLSLLEVTLHTGKTHQIRAHLAYVGLAVLGDRKYGNKEMNVKYNKQKQCLISYSIMFDFPADSKLYYLSNQQFKLNKIKDDLFN